MYGNLEDGRAVLFSNGGKGSGGTSAALAFLKPTIGRRKRLSRILGGPPLYSCAPSFGLVEQYSGVGRDGCWPIRPETSPSQ